MWHRRLAHLNHQDLRRLLESSGERITDSLDAEPVTHPDVELAAVPDIEPVMDPMDVEPVTDRMDMSPRWETH